MTVATQPKPESPTEHAFDAYARQYEAALQEGLRLSGESADYFAAERIRRTQEFLNEHDESVRDIFDFGCGVGLATPHFIEQFGSNAVVRGFDPSTAAIKRAKFEFGSDRTTFCDSVDAIADESSDLAYCNGVFHHIEPQHRAESLAIIYRALRPGGWFAFWENNPWNPGTRLIMSRIPFDQDAQTISPRHAGTLLTNAGFEVVQRQAWFLFPRMLSALRPLEPFAKQLPIGAQYVVFARKPELGNESR